ncbi:DUF86 domain-containing protein [Sulfurihydrogenibium subterraneum]|uniref:DUF86 domain-containing protein n=1 Tax=Sulfurihydrogenibium subterraneum TaxID=171121 RepID=UPI00048BB466|nr:HepT-like ribonuclease domain-containing protein [Sulfurihydrogenibium subterraneum]
MLNIEFLNEKATKVNNALKKVSKILDVGEDEFLKTPMYPDRVKYYLIILYDELEAIACHILSNIHNEKIKENCLEKLSQEGVFSEKLNRLFQDFVKFKVNLFESGFNYSEKELYHLSKEIVDTLSNLFLKELAEVVRQLKEKQPKLAVPVNLVKLNHHASVIKGEVKRLEPFKKISKEEFLNSNFAIDRSRYFLVVAIDSALWICRHLSRQIGLKPSKDCFKNLGENGVISQDVAQKLSLISSLRDVLADPTKEVDKELLYNLVKSEFEDVSNRFIVEVAKFIKYGKQE